MALSIHPTGAVYVCLIGDAGRKLINGLVLQAGQLDAGFFYVVEARTAGLPTVPLTPVYKYAAYTITILNNGENQAGSEALVEYLLAPRRKAVDAQYGLVALKPQFHGDAAAVPRALRSVVGAG